MQLRSSIPAWQDKQGISPAKDDGPGSRRAAVERKRHRPDRSAIGLLLSFSFFPANLSLQTHAGVLVKPTNRDWYESFEALSAAEQEGVDFRIDVTARPSPVAIVAPHGGYIEPHTSEIAAAIAGEDISLYRFEGLTPGRHHRELHVTSELFDEPQALALVEAAETVLGIHGRADDGDGDTVWVGGLDFERRDRVVAALVAAGFATVVRKPGESLAGAKRNNICNRCRSRKGVHLEIPRTLREKLGGDPDVMTIFADAIARAIAVA